MNSMAQNIAALRRARGMTQEQLGEQLGVSNQAVSKWESAVTYPDIMLLPKLAQALGVTMDELYGMVPITDRNQRVNDFPIQAQNEIQTRLHRAFIDDSPIMQNLIRGTSGETVGIISYTGRGAAFISRELSVISIAEWPKNDELFNRQEVALALRKLGDVNVQRILGWLYAKSFREMPKTADLDCLTEFERTHDWFDEQFIPEEAAEACHLTLEQTMEAVDKLISLHIVEVERENGMARYVFRKTKGIETAIALQVVIRLVEEPFGWGSGYLIGNNAIG